jgi:hypothetical protein
MRPLWVRMRIAMWLCYICIHERVECSRTGDGLIIGHDYPNGVELASADQWGVSRAIWGPSAAEVRP